MVAAWLLCLDFVFFLVIFEFFLLFLLCRIRILDTEAAPFFDFMFLVFFKRHVLLGSSDGRD